MKKARSTGILPYGYFYCKFTTKWVKISCFVFMNKT